MTRPNGAVIYEGPSQLTGEPIVGIVTGKWRRSSNRATGPMLQTFFLRQDMEPMDALKADMVAAICGTCPLIGDICYVNEWEAPTQVWRSWAAGKYPRLSEYGEARMFAGDHVRWGAYGDPCAIPLDVVARLTDRARGWTGYTHQWKWLPAHLARAWQKLLMASVDNVLDKHTAEARGWRTFRVRSASAPRDVGEMPCLKEPERSEVQCVRCPTPCNGGTGPSIVIRVHGNKAGSFPQEETR